MTRFVFIASVVFLLGWVRPAPAHFGFFSRPRPVTAYYYPVVVVPLDVYVAPPPVMCMPVLVAVPAPRLLAQPLPAPPSTGREPPLIDPYRPQAPPPSVPPASQPSGQPTTSSGVSQARESRYFDAYSVAPSASSQPNGSRCSVSFWNLSGRELVLKVGTQRMTLVRGRSVTLELEREFTWQIEGRESQTGRVGADESAQEIVIRR